MSDQKRKEFRPWRPGLRDVLRRTLTSDKAQISLQMGIGNVVVCLFVFIRAISFSNACLAAIFFYVAIRIGCLLAGATTAGVVSSLALACGRAYVPMLIVFSALALLVTATVRAASDRATGLLTNVVFGITIIQGQAQPISELWRQTVCSMYIISLVCALADLVGGLLIVPTRASDQLRANFAILLRGMGRSMSGYAARAFTPDNLDKYLGNPSKKKLKVHQAVPEASDFMADEDQEQSQYASSHMLEHSMTTHAPQYPNDHCLPVSQYWEYLDRYSDPQQPGVKFSLDEKDPLCIRMLVWRPMLLLCRRLIAEARAEPPVPTCPCCDDWDAGLTALVTLCSRVTALESVLEQRLHLIHDEELQQVLGVDVMPVFRLLFAEAASLCNALATAIDDCITSDEEMRVLRMVMEPAWDRVEGDLERLLRCIIGHYWRDLNFNASGRVFRPCSQVRTLLYVAAMTSGILEALADVKAATVRIVEGANGSLRARRRWRLPLPSILRSRWRPAPDPTLLQGTELSSQKALCHTQCEDGSAVKIDIIPNNGSRRSGVAGGHGSAALPLRTPEPVSPAKPERSPFAAASQPAATPSAAPDGASAAPVHDCPAATEQRDGHGAGAGPGEASISQKALTGPGRELQRRKSGREVGSLDMGRAVSSQLAEELAQARRAYGDAGEDDAKPAGSEEAPGEDSHEEELEEGGTASLSRHPAIKWIWPLLPPLVARQIVTLLFQIYFKRVPAMLRKGPCKALRNAWRHDRYFVFFVKFWAASTLLLGVVLALSAYVPGFAQWRPLYALLLSSCKYAMLTLTVVLSEKVDTTVMKSILRVFGTLIGGGVGFAVMFTTEVATNPYALAAITSILVALCGPLVTSPYKYAGFLTIVTANSVILCQWNPTPGATGSTHLLYARLADILVGVAIVLVVDLVKPWYVSMESLAMLGAAFAESTRLMVHYHHAFHFELRRAAQGPVSRKALRGGIETLERDILRDKIQKPLAAVQVQLAMESVLWQRYFLAPPPVVRDMLRLMEVVQDRLAAVELLLLQKPLVTGLYSEGAYHSVMAPIRDDMTALFDSCVVLGDAVEAALQEDAHEAELRAVEAAIHDLQSNRVAMRMKYSAVHAHLLERVSASSTGVARTPDDSIRFQSVMFALSRAMDKIALLARTVVQDAFVRRAGQRRLWQQRRLWLGK